MTERQMLLVKTSWSYAIVRSEETGQLFYQRLFETAPAVRHMFKGDTKEQARKLMSMITLIVSKLQKLDDIMNDIKSLAQRHDKYGAKPEHYAVVGECLLWTLRQGLAEKWDSETEEAWYTMYGILSAAMIRQQSQAIV